MSKKGHCASFVAAGPAKRPNGGRFAKFCQSAMAVRRSRLALRRTKSWLRINRRRPQTACEFAWNNDPALGVICIQSGLCREFDEDCPDLCGAN